MRDHDSPAEDAMPDRSEADRLARIDDVLAGQAAAFGRSPTETEAPSTSPPDDAEALLDEDALNTPTDLEMLLLLRQVAATERGLPETEEDTDTPPVVPPFEVVRIIGRGGFSSVFLAVDPRMSRTLALKLIRPEAMLMPGMRRRFLREAEIAARLNHPCIVTVHDVGAAEGRVYIAQEYCEGGSLAQWLATHEGPVPPREAAAFLLDVAEAVHAAHTAGVLHRDLKPANLLLVARQSATHEPPAGSDTDADRLSAWRAKVGDFGLATLRTDDSGAQLTRLTMTGCRLGTPAWMAPEQVDQSYGKVSEATDVYAMGLILERLLTGRVSQAASSDADSFRRILLEEPTPPDHLVPGLSADLAAVCVTCLQKKPKDRYASAAHLADDLRRFLDGKPTHARPLTPFARVWRSAATSPVASLLSIALALVVAVAAWAISRQPNVLPPEPVPAPPALTAERSEAAAELLSSFNAWRNGDAQRAAALFKTATSISPPLATTVAARWLERRIHGEDAILFQTAAESPLYSLATTNDGTLAAVAGADGTVAILPLAITSADDETPPLTILDVGEGINNAVFAPDGRQLAVVGEAGGLTLWDVESGREQHRSNWGKPLFGLAISPDGEWIVSGGEESVVRVAPLAAPADVVHTFDLASVRIGDDEKADSEIESITFVDDTRVAIAFGHQLIAFDTATGQLLRSVEAEAVFAVIDRVRASPAGDLVLTTAAHRGTPKLWSTTTWDVVGVLPEHAERVRDAAFSPDGGLIATAGKDGVIRVFDAKTLAETRRLVGHRGSVWKLTFLGASGLISAGDDGTARRWRLDRDPTQPPGSHLFPPLNADGQPFAGALQQITACTVCQLPGLTPAVAALDTKARLHLFNLATGFWRPPFVELGSFSLRLNGVAALASGDQVAVSINDAPLALVSTAPTATPRVQRFDEVDSTNCVLCGCGDGLVAFTSSDQALHLLDTRDGRMVELERSLHDVGCRALAAASQPPLRLLAADHDRIRIYTLTPAGDRLAPDRDLPNGAVDARTAAWSPDDATIACGAADGSVWIYDAAGLKPPRLITTHWNEVRGLAFDTSGHTLISCDAESIRFHDPDARVTFDEFTPGWEITGLALSPDEATLIICGSEGLCTLDLNVPPPLHIGADNGIARAGR